MDKVTLDEAALAALSHAVGETELVDAAGHPVGYFVHPDTYAIMRKAFYDWANAQVTDEELDAALADPRRYSTADVMKLVEEE